LAMAYEQVDKVQQAISQYQTIVEKYPNSNRTAPAMAALGRIAFKQKNYQQSYNYFNRLLEQGSEYRLEARIGMGNAQLAMNNIAGAKQQFQAALDINNGYDAANVGLARAALQQNDYQTAVGLLNSVAESNTTEVGAEAQYLLGVANQQQGNYQAAVDAFSRVNILYGAYNEWVAKAMLGKAKSYIELGKRSEAVSTLNTLIKNYPDTPQAQEAERLLN
ncbi:MAG TPA: tetratricopeptide repeat protein, partial [Balneolaceae bacterium]|nr:tetratricopeptide repeat protein [Balneolaceae bacterium]